ncbi:type I secretion system permease/ATPase, partial [Salmonella enterica subsp. enterica serovar Java]|nr:type I secretion system permease/ATPase [Salmonella enterica subsp. enterica serovar Abony]EDW4642189.1 type I secretion system permease/ATPase [Salmonella enterica subsp. enterica serovar Java]
MKLIIEGISLATQLLGSHLSVATLTAHTTRTENMGVVFSSLTEYLKSEGFENKLSRRSLDDIPTLSMPVVLLLKDEDSAVLTEIKSTENNNREFKIEQIDGLTVWLTKEELKKRYLGYCWFIKPRISADIRSELPEYTLHKFWLFKIIWKFKSYYYQIILSTFIINFLALISSLYVMNVYDRVIPNRSYQTLWVLSIGVILAILFEFITKIIRSRLTDIAGKKADLIISSALFRKILNIKLQERPTSSGSYANNIRDFESVREFMTSASILTLVDMPFLLLFVSIIGVVGGKLAFIPLTIIPIVIIAGVLAQIPLSRYINESMKESSQRQGLVVEAIEGIETLKTNNAINWPQKKWDLFTAKSATSSIKVKNISNFIIYFSIVMQQLNTVFLIIIGTYLIHSEDPSSKITMGALIASVILSGRALSPLGQIAGLAVRFQQAWTALKGVNNIVERKCDRVHDKKYITLNQTHGNLKFTDISFSYDNLPHRAVDKVSFTVKAGEKVGILGRIGSGKSTILKLATGLYQTDSGSITLDGVDIRQIDPYFLRSQILLLEQEPRLFLGTLRENIDLARMDGFSNDQDLILSLRLFGLDRIINEHPRGLDMFLGENGLGLSGGQKQIVALARMAMRDPKVVLLDEPTTGLDQQSEIQALNALNMWCRTKTLLVVTHRPQVLQIVNRIIVIDKGKIVMDGPRDIILKKL